MDLTPPALPYSPSPSHKEASSPSSFTLNSPRIDVKASSSTAKQANYSNSAHLLSLSYEPISPLSSAYSPPISDQYENRDHYLQLDSMSQPSWSNESPLLSSSSAGPGPSSIISGLSTDHSPFGSYHSGMNHAYGRGDNYHPGHVGASAMAHMASPVLGPLANSPNLENIRAPLNYSPAGAIKFQSHPLPYHHGLGTAQYPATSSMPSAFSPDAPTTMHPASHSSLANATQVGWKSEFVTTHGFYPSSFGTPSITSALGQASNTKTPLPPRAQDKAKRRHTKKEEANFQCQVSGCGKFFSRSYNFKSHMETHDEKREYPFHCQETDCTKRFVRKTDLQRHHQSVHAKVRNHRCDYCGRLFARKDTLRRHMEDGCPKRFDIETLSVRADNYDNRNSNRTTLFTNINSHNRSDSKADIRIHSRTPRSSLASTQSSASLPVGSLSSDPAPLRRGPSDSND